jgi:hypothetical protein
VHWFCWWSHFERVIIPWYTKNSDYHFKNLVITLASEHPASLFWGFFIPHTNRRKAVVLFQCIVGVAVHYFVFDFASLHVGRGIDMGSRHDDFLM